MLNPGLHMMLLTCMKKYKIGIVNLGLNVFQKNKDEKSIGQYRLMQEGLELILPHMDDRRLVNVEPTFFKQITQEPDKSFTFD